MAWHKVSLANDQIVKGEGSKLQGNFETLFFASGSPKEMALFSDRERAGKKDFWFYFSPACQQRAKNLIAFYSGVPCEKPQKDEVILLVGHADASELLG